MSTESQAMQGPNWLKVIRGLAYRTVWVLLYLSHLALAFVALAGFLGVAIFALDPNGGASNTAGRRVTFAQRCAMGLVSGSLGLAAAVASRMLLRSHQRINPLYPEMQIGFHTGGSQACERVTDSSTAMYDRDIDGVP
jgi:hypothetical protein